MDVVVSHYIKASVTSRSCGISALFFPRELSPALWVLPAAARQRSFASDGLENADAGSVTGIPQHLSAVFQENRLCEDFSAVANVRLVAGHSVSVAVIESHLLFLGLGGSLYLPARELSGGMKRRVALARAVLARWELLLLDEPFKGLDEDTRHTAAAYLREHSAGRTAVMVTHDPAEVDLTGGRLLRMLPAGG